MRYAVRSWRGETALAKHALLRTGEEILILEIRKPGRFELGQMVATPGAIETMERSLHIPANFLLRHNRGDWGDLGEEDKQENERALREGSRIFSAYETRANERLWVITEGDRSVTTLMLPGEY